MKTLLAASPNSLVYEDGEPLGNRASTLRTIVIPPELEWAPDRGGIVVRGHRISVSQIWACHDRLGWTAGYIAGCYGLLERDVQAAIRFCMTNPECVEPEDDEAAWWLDA